MFANRSIVHHPCRLAFPLVLALAALSSLTTAQARPTFGDREGLAREQMWRAPTEKEWMRPVLIEFQRTWEDALAVSKQTGEAILICVNMDGEIASEHYVGVRYRQPDIAKLYEPYVCVIASTYRHNPRDHDDQGRRILCPRFGSVTCGEHITIEPILFRKFFDGRRIAPRHIMVELDGSETFDVMLVNDTATVFDNIHDGIAKRENQPPPIVRGDRPILDRVASKDVYDRVRVEAAYREGDATQRRSLLEAARKQGGQTPLDLLRLAIFGLDVDLGATARVTLAQSENPAATDLIAEALRVPMDASERDALIAALVRLGKTLPRAQWLAVVHQGMAGRSKSVDPKAWANARAEYEATARKRELGEIDLDRTSKVGAYRANPDDATACIELAEASLDLAFESRKTTSGDPRMARAFSRHLFADARTRALAAEKLDAPAWRVSKVIALAAYYRGDVDVAYARAVAAMAGMPPGDPGWSTYALLVVFAEARWEGIKKAMDARRRVPHQWISDVNATYTALRDHPDGTDAQVVWHLDFLTWLRVGRQVDRVLRQGLERFPDSSALHRRFRTRILKTRGIDALEAAYARMMKEEEGAPPRLLWFAGYASHVAAEFHRRARQAGKALLAYGRAIDLFERAVVADPGLRLTTDHRLALAFAGRGHLCFELGDDDHAFEDLMASLTRQPAAAGRLDGLGFTPAGTAQLLLLRLRERKRDDLAAKLTQAISNLDPELLPRD